MWYATGSKPEGVGADIYRHRPEIQILVSLSKDAKMFQAERNTAFDCHLFRPPSGFEFELSFQDK